MQREKSIVKKVPSPCTGRGFRGGVILITFIALLLGACSSLSQSAAQEIQATVTPIPTAPAAARPTFTVQRGTVQQVLSFTGRWLPRDQLQLSFEINGTIRAVNVRRDDTVGVGDLLADFQITDLEDQLANAQISLETARLRLESGSLGSEQAVINAQIALANAEISLETTRANTPSLDSARISLENAITAVSDAQRNYDDVVSRPDSQASQVDSAFQQIQSAQTSLERSQNDYNSAVQNYNVHQLNIARSENDVLQRQLDLDEALSGRGTDPELFQSLASAQLNVDQIGADIERSSLVAPIDGVVLEIAVQPGASVQAFDSVITLALPEPKEVIANLSFNDIQQMSAGMLGICQEINRPETAVQCIVRQLPLSSRDVDQTVRVAASLEGVQQGQIIEVEMPLQVQEDVLWLPPEAIRTFQNRRFVVLDTPDGQRVVDIEVGLETDEQVEIVSGLEEGDVIVGQ